MGQSAAPWARPVSDYFCLADGRTAALVSRDGSCDFLCWPDFDSPMRLCSLLDPAGGSVKVGPRAGEPLGAAFGERSTVLRIRWPSGLAISCGLLDDGAGRSVLVWLVEGRSGEVIEVRLVHPTAGGGPRWRRLAGGAELPLGGAQDGPLGPLLLVATEDWLPGVEPLSFLLGPSGIAAICLGGPLEDGSWPPALRQARARGEEAARQAQLSLEELAAQDRAWLEGLALPNRAGMPSWAGPALDRSLLTLRSLQGRRSGMTVASPTTSIPQWPGSARAWDYRYGWLRDSADAGMALARVGAKRQAWSVAEGLARALGDRPDLAPPVSRLNGQSLPPEHLLPYLEGYCGAVVRIGNGAAGQAQLDTLGEVVDFAAELDRTFGCPGELLDRLPALASRAAASWDQPDHGIWEVRGELRQYVHSKVLAWTALTRAAGLARRGRISGNPASFATAAEEIAAAVWERGTGSRGELLIAFDGEGSDAALLTAYQRGFPGPGGRLGPATLDLVLAELGRGPLLARYQPEADGIPWPCAPFIFPSLWAVSAEARLSRREQAEGRLQAIVKLAGPAGQLSEVADPDRRLLLGNYPQVQSHAALVLALLDLWGEPPAPE